MILLQQKLALVMSF